MGYVSYEAATLLDGHPAPHPDEAPCPPIGVARDRPCGRVRPLAAAAGAGRPHARRTATTGVGKRCRSWPRRSPRRPRSRCSRPPARRASRTARPNMDDEAVPLDRLGVQGAHPGRRHLPGGAVATGDVRRPDGGLPIYRRLRVTNPAPYMFFLRHAGDGARRFLAGTARPRRRAARHRRGRSPGPVRAGRPRSATGCSNTSFWPTRRNRPSTRCSWTWHATTWAGLRPRDRPAHRADGGRAVLQGDAHRVDGRGRAPPRYRAFRRVARDVPGRDRDRRAETPGDGVDRGARATPRGRTRGPSAT